MDYAWGVFLSSAINEEEALKKQNVAEFIAPIRLRIRSITVKD